MAQHSEADSGVPKRIAYSVREVSLRVGVSQPFIRLEIKRGNLRASKLGRRVVVLEESMNQWLERGTG